MLIYEPKTSEINFLLKHVVKIDELLDLKQFKNIDLGLIEAVVEEAGKFAKESLFSLNQSGDKAGCKFSNHSVTMPTGFKDAYSQFVANGWNSIAAPAEFGGQALPFLVSTAVAEFFNSANVAFSLCPLLTQGAIELLHLHGTAVQKNTYLPNLVSGIWTGTMCLTEPQAGSDLGAIKTLAQIDESNDRYLIKGTKIFITYGEHDMPENIIHMVLARTKDAPEGSRGISLFIVPKILEDGTRNDVQAISIEKKMGIHASPTCVMSFGDNNTCVGYLVGKENEGLKYMFSMMNNARLAVGIEGLAIAETAYQNALHYANERNQGGTTINNHPDVTRMLDYMGSNILAMRILALITAKHLDISKYSENNRDRERSDKIVQFLIPIIKAHITNLAFSTASEAIQVYGGMGYIEESGLSQLLRDARITMIYEGTNGIQAKDLVFRKLLQEDVLESFLNDFEEAANLGEKQYVELFLSSSKTMRELAQNNKEKAELLSTTYLELCGIITGYWCLLKIEDTKESNNYGYKKLFNFYKNFILKKSMYLADLIINH